MKVWNSRQNRRKSYNWPGEILKKKKKKKKMKPYECLRNCYKTLAILTNFLRTYDLLTINLRIPWDSFPDNTNTYECRCKSCECLQTPYEWNEYTTCACQCFLFVIYSPMSTEWISGFKKSRCYPSSYPGAEERAVVAEAGARGSLTIPFLNKKDDVAAFSMARPRRLRPQVTRSKRQGCQEA